MKKYWPITVLLSLAIISGIVFSIVQYTQVFTSTSNVPTTERTMINTTHNKDCVMYTVTAAQLNVRQDPTSKGKVTGKVNKGEKVCVSSFSNTWAKMSKGWVSKSHIKK